MGGGLTVIYIKRMDDFFSPDSAAPAGNESAPVEEIEIIPEQGSSPVDLSAEFAELNDAAPVMQEDDLRKMTVQGEVSEEKVDPSAMYSGISMADDRINQLQSESNKMREWREQNTARIEAADSKEKTDEVDWKEQAKKQKDDFYKQYEAENAKRKSENRAAEQNDVVTAPGDKAKAWQQLSGFINFNQARQANETDKLRMKSLLFQLKQEPPKAAA